MRRLRPFFLSRTSLLETERLRARAAAAERAAPKRCPCARSVQPGVVQVNIMSAVPFFSFDWSKDSEVLGDQGLVVPHLAGGAAERDGARVEAHDLVGKHGGGVIFLSHQGK